MSETDKKMPPMSNSAATTDKQKILSMAGGLNPKKPVKDDKGLKNRDNMYNDILGDYRDAIHNTLTSKHVYKIITYIIVSAILVAITASTIVLLFMYRKFDTVEWIAVAVPMMISFLTTFIVIPKIIAGYLFDKDEEKHMTDLLKILIEYDKTSKG